MCSVQPFKDITTLSHYDITTRRGKPKTNCICTAPNKLAQRSTHLQCRRGLKTHPESLTLASRISTVKHSEKIPYINNQIHYYSRFTPYHPYVRGGTVVWAASPSLQLPQTFHKGHALDVAQRASQLDDTEVGLQDQWDNRDTPKSAGNVEGRGAITLTARGTYIRAQQSAQQSALQSEQQSACSAHIGQSR